MLQEEVDNLNVRYMVLITYRHFLPPPNIMRERFLNHLNTSRTEADANMQVHQNWCHRRSRYRGSNNGMLQRYK